MASEAMENLASRYAHQAVRSIFVYTREAHPGKNHRHHKTIDDKRANAHAFKQHSKINRESFLDDMIGTAHRAYGTLPNMTWIMGRGGFIHYKSSWTGVDDVEDALKGIIDFQENRMKNNWIPFYSERSCWSKRDPNKFKEGLERAGPQAVADFSDLTAARKNEAPNLEVAPKIPGNFFVPEREG